MEEEAREGRDVVATVASAKSIRGLVWLLGAGGVPEGWRNGREADDAFVYSRVLLLYIDHAAYW